ncbi:uroporphyrinogen-III synthase [Rhodobacter capsulatus]|nr:uroporphyrinogen-III synthase [Rhodobacter capsulatus]
MSPVSRPPLLLTRPRAGSERFAAQFRARMGEDWPVLIAPLLETEPTGAALPAANALIFTSEQAVKPLAESALAGLPAFCVGARTAAMVRQAGFPVLAVAPDAEHLCDVILTAADPGPILHARGSESAFPLAERLCAAGRRVAEAIVYAQLPRPPGPEMLALFAQPGPVLVPVFSPNSGKLLTLAAQGARAELRLVAISEKAARACTGLPATKLQIAARPDAEALLDALVALA